MDSLPRLLTNYDVPEANVDKYTCYLIDQDLSTSPLSSEVVSYKKNNVEGKYISIKNIPYLNAGLIDTSSTSATTKLPPLNRYNYYVENEADLRNLIRTANSGLSLGTVYIKTGHYSLQDVTVSDTDSTLAIFKIINTRIDGNGSVISLPNNDVDFPILSVKRDDENMCVKRGLINIFASLPCITARVYPTVANIGTHEV